MARGYTPHPGVTIDQLPSGAFRVRWRADGKQRSASRPTRAEAEQLAREVGAARLLGQAPVVEVGSTVDAVFTAWLRERKAYGCAPGTLDRYLATATRILAGLRDLRGIPAGTPVPASALTRDGVAALASHLRTGDRPLSENTVRTMFRALADAWTWASDDPSAFPGLAPAPRDRKRLVPRGTPYNAPKAPTMAELDAVIRQLGIASNSGRVALPVAVVMRSTGLRVSQVGGILVGDVNLAACTLFVRTGKSQREKADPRTLPIPAHLAEYLRDRVVGRSTSERLIPIGRSPDPTLSRAWRLTTAAGLTRLEVWKPPGRVNARPDHAFRAAYQAHLVTNGVRDEIVDRLVGYPSDTRASHYVGEEARWEAMRAAVDLIPDIEWRTEESAPSNVLSLKR